MSKLSSPLLSSPFRSSPPVVSIITIFLNAELYIQEAIESAIAQTFEPWELLLIDDGSTDGSTAIAQQYAAQYPDTIKYLHHDDHLNCGMSASRNLGIRNAQGQYISFLDADDLWLPTKLEQQLAILEAHPEAAFVCSPAKWWYSWTDPQPDPQPDSPQDFIQRLNVTPDQMVPPPTLLLLFLQDEWASLCDLVVRSEVVEHIGGYENTFKGMYEDQAFHAKLCLQSPAIVTRQCWYWYRQHPTACTALSHQAKQWKVLRHRFLAWLESYLLSQGFEQTEVWQVVQQEIWPFRHPILSRILVRAQNFVRRIKALSASTPNRLPSI